MNERIRELLSQVGVHYEVMPKDTVYGKFAELIVRECVDQIIEKGTDWIDWMPSQLGIRPEYMAMAQHIKQHFGVE